MDHSKALTGITGVYFVAAELASKGYIATVTSRNTDGIDILSSNIDGTKVVSIQVKTSAAKNRRTFSRSWRLTKKHERIVSDSLFYVFVDLNENDKKPDFYIVPSRVVANYIKRTHKKWLRMPSKTGKKHNDWDGRLFEIENERIAEKYMDRWTSLGL